MTCRLADVSAEGNNNGSANRHTNGTPNNHTLANGAPKSHLNSANTPTSPWGGPKNMADLNNLFRK